MKLLVTLFLLKLYACINIFNAKSLCKALLSSNSDMVSIHETINFITSSVFTLWMPGESIISAHQLTNRAVKKATTIATKTILPVSLSSFLQVRRFMITFQLWIDCSSISTLQGSLQFQPNHESRRQRTAC